MSLLPLPKISVAEVIFEGRFLDTGHLPPFRGSTLRGALGYHLRNTVCNTFRQSCPTCFLRCQCAYSLFFEGTAAEDRTIMRLYDHVPQPFMFVLNIADKTEIKPNDPLIFGMKIFGDAGDLFPYVAYALFEAGKKGIGGMRLRYKIESIRQNETILYEKEGNVIRKPSRRFLKLEEPDEWENEYFIEILLLSPLRIRSEGHTAKHLLFSDFIKGALRRITILNAFYGDKVVPSQTEMRRLLDFTGKVQTVTDALSPFGFERYSGRQKNNMLLDGVIGKISFRNVHGELVRLLRITEPLGLGKSTSFGFGRISITAQRG
jgi:CRISPR-associated endoribonuclease Cas6